MALQLKSGMVWYINLCSIKPTGQETGLSLSYDIVKVYGGELKVETEEGKGTIFSILLMI